MSAYDDLNQLLAYGSSAGGDSGLGSFEGFWLTSMSQVDFAYPGSIDLYALRTKIESPIDITATIL